jgi:hypothetical protein
MLGQPSMVTFFIIIGCIILTIVGLAFYSINSRRPKFFRGDLKPFEKSLYKELENQLPSSVGRLIPQQLNYLKRGVRLYFDKSYTLELYEDKNNQVPNDKLFNRKDEFKLSTLSFSHNDIKYKAEFKTSSGMLYGLTVKPSPKSLVGTVIKKFDKFTLNNDPTEKLDLEIVTVFYTDTDELNGLISELKKIHNLANVKKPLPEKQRQLFIKLSETKLPEDYLLLCNQTNGFDIDNASVFGLGTFQSVSLDDDNYLMLAEKSNGCLTIKQSKRTTNLKYHSYEDETDIRDLGDNFMKALETFIATK